MAGVELEVCVNCGRRIGALETTMVWNENVVCGECHTRILSASQPSGKSRTSLKMMRVRIVRPQASGTPQKRKLFVKVCFWIVELVVILCLLRFIVRWFPPVINYYFRR